MSSDSSVDNYSMDNESIASADLDKYEEIQKDLRQQTIPQGGMINDSDMYDDDESSDDGVQSNIEKEQDELMGAAGWGRKKKDYYNKDDESDNSSDEVNELDEVKRLQAIRAKKLQKQQQKSESDSEPEQAQDVEDDADQQDEQESDSSSDGAAFGDKLFGSKITSTKDTDMTEAVHTKLLEVKELLKDMKSVCAQLQYSIDLSQVTQISGQSLSITNKTINFIKQFGCGGDKTLVKRNQKVIDFLKVK